VFLGTTFTFHLIHSLICFIHLLQKSKKKKQKQKTKRLIVIYEILVEIHLSKQSNFLSVWMRLVHKVDHLLVKLVLCIDTET